MKYLTMKTTEKLEDFKRRVKFELGHTSYYIQNISESMGRGVQIITLMDEVMNLQVKLEVDMYNTDEVLKDYKYLSAKPVSKSKKNSLGLGNIEDLYN